MIVVEEVATQHGETRPASSTYIYDPSDLWDESLFYQPPLTILATGQKTTEKSMPGLSSRPRTSTLWIRSKDPGGKVRRHPVKICLVERHDSFRIPFFGRLENERIIGRAANDPYL